MPIKFNVLLEVLNSKQTTTLKKLQAIVNFNDCYKNLCRIKQEQFDSFNREIQLAILKKMQTNWTGNMLITVKDVKSKQKKSIRLFQLFNKYCDHAYLTEDSVIYLEVPLKTPSLCWNKQLFSLFICDCAENILHYFEENYPDDYTPRNALQVVRRYVLGDATEEELLKAREEATRAKERANPHRFWYEATDAAESVLCTTYPWCGWKTIDYVDYAYQRTQKRYKMHHHENRLWEYLSGKFSVKDAKKLYGNKPS
ncbi:MAG: hypothetical protein CO137_03440 [Candidatus Magasanikbacteria bacterium CG_4_9_14_3_um_filter_32_9]|uniref:Imm-5-like domain-containing protein n=1 Tax=Candidatus Magasanikbacteria bacterium CG_4_9_14_3_um_filter_32_9 TaxID=1974644 RepID=A0A2M7Z627_9BACT|nr:MAG: hypothetical protein CO137_03440 [Candidatus Magasanikbacteria bacterium CG_4_9_14_3_um_filter_32_9]